MDLPRIFGIRESNHRILNPFTPEKLATLGNALHLAPGTRVLDLACGKGEMLCTWARDHNIVGTGVDISTGFVTAARERAAELGVTERVEFLHGNAAGYVASERVDVASCCGATWIGDGLPGTLDLLAGSLLPAGVALVGEPYWRRKPTDEATLEGCHATSVEDFRTLAGLVESFGELGWDLVEMVLADQDSWDRYVAAQWWNLRTWLDAHPDDELAGDVREELDRAPLQHVTYQREFLGWGVFALIRR